MIVTVLFSLFASSMVLLVSSLAVWAARDIEKPLEFVSGIIVGIVSGVLGFHIIYSMVIAQQTLDRKRIYTGLSFTNEAEVISEVQRSIVIDGEKIDFIVVNKDTILFKEN